MIISEGRSLTNTEIEECVHLSTFGAYEIYRLDGCETYFFAVDSSLEICAFIEFVDKEYGWQAAHAHTKDSLKRNGLGTALMKEAVDYFKEFELPSTNNEEQYYFIENGLNFINRCFDKGILTEPPFKRPYGSDKPEDY